MCFSTPLQIRVSASRHEASLAAFLFLDFDFGFLDVGFLKVQGIP
jgi:hypothetical protein